MCLVGLLVGYVSAGVRPVKNLTVRVEYTHIWCLAAHLALGAEYTHVCCLALRLNTLGVEYTHVWCLAPNPIVP